jgi:hypothetical protein
MGRVWIPSQPRSLHSGDDACVRVSCSPSSRSRCDGEWLWQQDQSTEAWALETCEDSWTQQKSMLWLIPVTIRLLEGDKNRCGFHSSGQVRGYGLWVMVDVMKLPSYLIFSLCGLMPVLVSRNTDNA